MTNFQSTTAKEKILEAPLTHTQSKQPLSQAKNTGLSIIQPNLKMEFSLRFSWLW